MLFPIIANYETSGNGGGQRQEDDSDWGSTNLMETSVVDGDDRNGFLTLGGKQPENEKHFYVLYFWHLLDEGGLVQFTLAKLPKYIAADSESFNLVSPLRGPGLQQDSRAQLAASVGLVADGFGAIAANMIAEQLDNKYEKLYDVEMELADPSLLAWKEPVLKKRKLTLEAQIDYIESISNG